MQKLQVMWLSGDQFDATKIEQSLLQDMNTTHPSSALPLSGNVSNDPRAALLNAYYQAPEFAGLQNRINTSGRNSISDLKGKVVIIDFWTYSCINCIRTLPYMEARYQKYAGSGLVII